MGRFFWHNKNGQDLKFATQIQARPDPIDVEQALASEFRRFPHPINYVKGSHNDEEKFIIIPRQNIELIQLLKAFGAEIEASIRRIHVDNPSDHLLMTLPPTLNVTSGRVAHTGEFESENNTQEQGIVPEIIKSNDGRIVAGLFHTFAGDFQLIGPTWRGITDRFTNGQIELFSPDVMDINIGDLRVTGRHKKELEEAGMVFDLDIEIPVGRNWELFFTGVKDLANYPVEHHCKSDYALSIGLKPSSSQAQEAFDKFVTSVDQLHTVIRFIRGSRLQETISSSPDINDQLRVNSGLSVGD